MSLQAYQQAATRVESPRETEYRLFAQVTLALMEASRADPNDFGVRVDALDWNRRVWTVLADACASSDNMLPAQLRASIISLALWVSRHTSAVIRKEEEFGPLIEVNRLIMQGLAPTPNAAAA